MHCVFTNDPKRRLMKIGIIREGRIPPDKRVPFTPEQCRYLCEQSVGWEIIVQPSSFRCFPDHEYRERGIRVQEDLSECDLLMGIKEVPVSELLPDKTYFFFSHTIKKQPHNRELLGELVRRRIRMIDYEVLTDSFGNRLIGFGRFAGLVGAYNGLRAYGLRHRLFNLKPAWSCASLDEMKEQLNAITLPGIKILVTGSGRAGSGVMELLDGAGVSRISSTDYMSAPQPAQPVVVQVDPDEYARHREGKAFSMDHFFKHPREYQSTFLRFLPHTDLLICAAYWDPQAPVLFSAADTRSPDFRISVIADVSCDINGSVPVTRRTTTIQDPFYDYNPETDREEAPFSGDRNITVMAVDNLPCEVPRDASFDFGNTLIEKVLPCILGDDPGEILKRATITSNGALTERFSYLQDFTDEY